ncbi:DUF2213 domain-containing protein [Rhizobium rhizogenes]|uniref:DUF2213 domain-containing protein n=1 Tax=Rhizobium rhizogenes TaxID=359 RepID=UPI002270964E|nr:DUF2213 domain-containing protein [Rhizobium rhizogenes]
MFAASEGRSKLGIPENVGKEFVGKDALDLPLAAGVVFIAPDGAVLLLCRSSQEANYGGHWALPGGKGEPGETPWQIVCRETSEEIGTGTEHAWIGEPTIVDETATPTGMVFTTFVQPVRYRFTPELDAEHSGFVWATADGFPSPMHPQVARVLGLLFPKGDIEVMNEQDAASDGLAIDRATVRSKDADGHMRVEVTPISKANVCPYYGREIPNWQALGLDPDKVYNLYRDPEELAKGAKSFAGKPLLLIHTPAKAEDHPREVTVGAVGDGVVFDPPYLKAPLTIWDDEAIKLIESGEQKELSSSYRYTPVMTPGVGPDGQRFDGRMTDIVANHVALVEKGRAGPDVLVADSAPAGLAATAPNGGVPAGGVKRAPAQDTEEEPGMAAKAKDSRARDEDPKAKLMEGLKEKLSAEDYKVVCDGIEELMKAKAEDSEAEEEDKKAKDAEAEEAKKKAADEAAEAEAKKKAAEDDDEDEEAEDESVSREAMDSAIKAAVAAAKQEQVDLREAERFCRPIVGELAVAFDSAPALYKKALEMRGVKIDASIPASAYRPMLEALPSPSQQRSNQSRLAMDSAKPNDFAARYADAAKVRVSL